MACVCNEAEREAGNISEISMIGSNRLGSCKYIIVRSRICLRATLGFDNDGLRQWSTSTLDAAQEVPLRVQLSSVGEARYGVIGDIGNTSPSKNRCYRHASLVCFLSELTQECNATDYLCYHHRYHRITTVLEKAIGRMISWGTLRFASHNFSIASASYIRV